MQNVTHDDHIHFRQWILEEISGHEAEAPRQIERSDVFFGQGLDGWKVKDDSIQVGMSDRDLRRDPALRSANVRERQIGRASCRERV